MEWFEKIDETVREKLAGSRDKDIRFFRVEEFLRMAKRADDFAQTCRECSSFKHQIEQATGSIDKAVNHAGRDRRTYDRLIGKLSSHMQKQHQFYPPYHFTYLYSAAGMAGAGIAGFLISLPFTQIDRWFFIVPAFVVGLIAGNFIGARKDAKVRNSQKLL